MTQEFAIVNVFKSARRGSELLWWSSILMAGGMVMCMALATFDARLIAGLGVWQKPAKFFLSFGVHGMTLAWAVSLLPQPQRGIKTASWIFIFAAWAEMTYIVFRAARGEASHFNQSSGIAIIMYVLMGVGALALVSTSGFIGWRIWQKRADHFMREAAALGLMLGSFLGLVAGAYLSSHGSHWIGGDMTDATGLPLFRWSTSGGDLRVAHFIGLHATQAVPLAGLSGNRLMVWAIAAAVIMAMAATFVQASLGIPLFRV